MPMWIRDASGSDAGPRHRTSYLYAKAGAAKSSNVRRALGTVDDRENRNAWVDEGECSVQCVRLVSLKARGEASAAASGERPRSVSAGPAVPKAPRSGNDTI